MYITAALEASTWVARKSLNKNDLDQVLWARETAEHPTQTLVLTKTAGRHNLVEAVFI